MSEPTTRDRLLDATVDEIAVNGFDQARTTRIAAAVGLTTGAVFGYWENVEELLIDTWSERLWVALEERLDAAVEAARGEGQAEEGAIRVAEDPIGAATADMLIAARRLNGLHEVVSDDLAGWHARASQDGSEAVALAVFAVVAGATVLEATARRPRGQWRGVMIALGAPRDTAQRSFAESVAAQQAAVGSPAAEVLPDLPADEASAPDGDDSLRTSLLDATRHIVAENGLSGATVTRIARRAKVDRMALYRRYTGIEELLVDALRDHVRARLAEDGQTALLGMRTEDPPAAMALALVSTTQRTRSADRRLRLEAHLAARHRPIISEALGDLVDDAVARVVEDLGFEHAAVAEIARQAVSLYQAVMLGLAVSLELAESLIDRDALFSVLTAAMRALEQQIDQATGAAS